MSSQFPDLDTKAIENRWQSYWQDNGIYQWDEAEERKNNYVIDTPPPTVSGFLHIGHVYSYTHTDFIARFQRMSGMNVYYPIGFDDNGLPTERLVESRRKIRASDMTREAFVQLCHEVVQDAEDDFRALFKRIALSVDWRTEYRTISPLAWKISQMSLLDLYRNGHLYRSPQPSLWDPADRTAIAQAEVVEKEQQGTMYTIPFGLPDGGTVEIATTRPELLPACVALMIHPEDDRAADLLSKRVWTPLLGVEVPVVADHRVDRAKGSGLVMCCTFGDQTDVDWWREHRLPLRIIVGRDGRLTNLDGIGAADWPCRDIEAARRVAEALVGHNVRKARGTMVELLCQAGLLLREQAVTQAIPCAERSGAPLEILVTEQWMVRLLDKKQQLLDAGRAMRWHPEFMLQRYEEWVNNLKWDWCISRQRYFGVPLPFWYSKRPGEEGKIICPAVDELPINPLATPPRGYTMDEVVPEADVMDTWATSSVSPQINSRAISREISLDYERHRKLFPATLRPQAHEIIRTWTFYTVAKAVLHEGCPPFRDLAISGWCLAADQSKMSKSKGNVVTPAAVLDRYGVDVIRYWTAQGRLGRDTAYSEDVLKVGKRLTIKLWNASKLVAAHIGGVAPPYTTAAEAMAAGAIRCGVDRWCLTRLAETVEAAREHLAAYDYSDALAVVERFFWKQYCDNFLELAKGRLYGEVGSEAERDSARVTLFFAHRTLLGLFAPFLPYITEELLSLLYPQDFARLRSIHVRGGWPDAAALGRDGAAAARGEVAVDILSAIRKLKSAHNASIRTPLDTVSVARLDATAQGPDWDSLGDLLRDVAFAANCQGFASVDAPDGAELYEGEKGLVRISARLAV